MEAFIANWEGPPRRELHIWTEAALGANELHGWCFAVAEADESGTLQPLYDSWEATFEEILRYPEVYAPRGITWRREDTGDVIDIYNLQR